MTLLLAAGVAPGQIPDGTEARMSLWRDQVAGRQLLLVLDDAVGSEQVVPLLPGAGGSLVLVTSRRRMSALEDATAISLDTLPGEEAAAGLAAARRGLEALYDQYLLTEPAAGRYRMHDLIREHSRVLAGRADPEEDRGLATGRLLDFYQHTGALADTLIARHTRPGAAAADGPVPAAVPPLTDTEDALT